MENWGVSGVQSQTKCTSTKFIYFIPLWNSIKNGKYKNPTGAYEAKFQGSMCARNKLSCQNRIFSENCIIIQNSVHLTAYSQICY